MDRHMIYADLNLPRDSSLEISSPPSLPRDICQGPHWHQFALKVGCAVIIILALTAIALSVSVIFILRQKSSTEKSSVDFQEKRNETTERLGLLKCPVGWHPFREKCLFFSPTSNTWNGSLADCSTKESNLLLIQDQEELGLIQNLKNDGGILYWIGLNFTLPENNWKWINGSFLKPNVLKITGVAKENSCVCISWTDIFSENCETENKWICQKELKSVRNKVCVNKNKFRLPYQVVLERKTQEVQEEGSYIVHSKTSLSPPCDYNVQPATGKVQFLGGKFQVYKKVQE